MVQRLSFVPFLTRVPRNFGFHCQINFFFFYQNTPKKEQLTFAVYDKQRAISWCLFCQLCKFRLCWLQRLRVLPRIDYMGKR